MSLTHEERILLWALDREVSRETSALVDRKRKQSIEQYVATKRGRR